MSVLGELQRRAKIGFNLHRSLRFEVHPHGTIRLLWLCHLLYCTFPIVSRKHASLGFGKRKELINDTHNQWANANFFQQLGMIWRFEEDASWVEGNSSVNHS